MFFALLKAARAKANHRQIIKKSNKNKRDKKKFIKYIKIYERRGERKILGEGLINYFQSPRMVMMNLMPRTLISFKWNSIEKKIINNF